MLQIYNSFTRKKEQFIPIVPNNINMYVCGITVYDRCHIGHARSFLAFDMIVRYLKYSKYKVKFVRNITDIDDKIIKRAAENNEHYADLTKRVIASMHNDAKKLNLLNPELEPRATEYMPQIIALIEKLIAKNYAYATDNGDVYYEISKFNNYGKLSNKTLSQLESGARIEVNNAKRNALDFVLWKAAKNGEPYWDTPWGKGRPGWHIECSAMALECLGETFDLHGGGCDLQFPHHENEIAQSEAATGKKFANYWLHNGFLQINNEKMSKSLNNFLTIEEILENFDAEVLRYLVLSSHYRTPVEYSDEKMHLAHSAILRLYTSLRDLPVAQSENFTKDNEEHISEFEKHMNDDFNTPRAIAVLFNIAREINKLKTSSKTQAVELGAVLRYLAGSLGLLYQNPNDFLKSNLKDNININEIEALIEQRSVAREEKNWQLADQLRDKILALGIVVEDTPSGTLWRAAL